ncbi:MAG TPA: PKD domain-containing protein [Candidatus Thermoplasmatota archaeon]|nr:PKD domain-containing protein [Candidatus Thermoplasmatota archaeon]
MRARANVPQKVLIPIVLAVLAASPSVSSSFAAGGLPAIALEAESVTLGPHASRLGSLREGLFLGENVSHTGQKAPFGDEVASIAPARPAKRADPVEPEPVDPERLPPVTASTTPRRLHPPIVIADNAGFASPSSGVVRGRGTAVDPYVIEGWEIVGGENTTAIVVRNTTAHVIIRDLLIRSVHDRPTSAFFGFDLADVANLAFEGNIVLHTSHAGRVFARGDVVPANVRFEGNLVRDMFASPSSDLTNLRGCIWDIWQGGEWCTGVEVAGRGLVIAGNAFVDAPTRDAALYGSNVHGAHVRDNLFHRAGGIWLSGNGNLVENNTLEHTWARSGRSLSDGHITRFDWDIGVYPDARDYHGGIAVVGNDATIRANLLRSADGVFVGSDRYASLVRRALVEANVLERAGGVHVVWATDVEVLDNDIDGLGVWVFGAERVRIAANAVTTVADDGVLLYFSYRGHVENNTLVGDPLLGANWYGIRLLGWDGHGRFRPVVGHHVLADNLVTGFDRVALAVVAPEFEAGRFETVHDNLVVRNRFENSTWGYLFLGVARLTLRDNVAADVRYGIRFYPFYTDRNIDHDIDGSNVVNGRPLLFVTRASEVDVNGNLTQYHAVIVLRADRVAVRNQVMRDGGDRVFLYRVKDAVVERNVFGGNWNSVVATNSNLTVRSNTFEDDAQNGVSFFADWWPVRTIARAVIEDNLFTSRDAPGWYPTRTEGRDLGHAALEIIGADAPTIRNNLFENRHVGANLRVARAPVVEDNVFRGAGTAIKSIGSAYGLVRGNLIERAHMGIVDAGGIRDVVENNVVLDAKYGIASDGYRVTIRDNVVSFGEIGVYLGAYLNLASASGEVHRNLVVADHPTVFTGVGIYIDHTTYGEVIRVENNTAHVAQGFGLVDVRPECWTATPSFIARANRVEWSAVGLYLWCTKGDVAIPAKAYVVADNHVRGNMWGIYLEQLSTSSWSLDAKRNWWGSARGPTHPANPAGDGDAAGGTVAGTVAYDPWLEAPPARGVADLGLTLSGPSSATAGLPATFGVAAASAVERALLATGEGRLPRAYEGLPAAVAHTFATAGDRRVVAAAAAPGAHGLASLAVGVANPPPSVHPSVLGLAVAGRPAVLDARVSAVDAGYTASIRWTFPDGAVSTATAPAPAPSPAAREVTPLRAPVLSGPLARVAVFTEGPAADRVDEIAALGGAVRRVWTLVDGFSAVLPEDAVARLEAQDWVRAVVRDEPMELAALAAHRETRVREAADLGFLGRGVAVAVVDSGITDAHPDLEGQVLEGVDWSWNCDTAPPCPNADDELKHGTGVGGAIAGLGRLSNGAHAGVAPGAKLVDVKVIDRDPIARDAYVPTLDGLDWIAENHERLGIRVVYVGLVRSCQFDMCFPDHRANRQPIDAFGDFADALVERGLVVVLPAGNRGLWGRPDIAPDDPLAFDARNRITPPGNARLGITVGAVEDHGTPDWRDDTLASFSSRGGGLSRGKPDLVAPGVAVTAPVSFAGRHSASAFTGTSFAAAQVAGIAALLLEKDPSLDPAGVKDALLATARKLPSDPGPTPNAAFGWGLVDAVAALERVDGATPSRPVLTFPTPGRHALTVAVVDNLGRETVETVQVAVHGVIPSFTWSPATAGVGELVAFADRSVALEGAALSFAWEFGDGSTSAERNPTHAYAAPGLYRVNLTVTEADVGAWTYEAKVAVGSLVANAGPDRTVDRGRAAVFDASQSRGVNTAIKDYLWDFGDGTPVAKGRVVTHAFADLGVYRTTLTVRDAAGRTSSDTIEVTVVPPYGLRVETPTLPPGSAIVASPGETLRIPVTVTATGERDDNVSLHVLGLPSGWSASLDASPPIAIERGQSRVVNVSLKASSSASGPASVVAIVRATSENGATAASVAVRVEVPLVVTATLAKPRYGMAEAIHLRVQATWADGRPVAGVQAQAVVSWEPGLEGVTPGRKSPATRSATSSTGPDGTAILVLPPDLGPLHGPGRHDVSLTASLAARVGVRSLVYDVGVVA